MKANSDNGCAYDDAIPKLELCQLSIGYNVDVSSAGGEQIGKMKVRAEITLMLKACLGFCRYIEQGEWDEANKCFKKAATFFGDAGDKENRKLMNSMAEERYTQSNRKKDAHWYRFLAVDEE